MKNEICSADWNTAKKICRSVGGRLPSIDELEKVVKNCGGISERYGDRNWGNQDSARNKNITNSSYQTCYKAKGFSASNDYWSSISSVGDEDDAWGVYFYGGDGHWDDKSYIDYVRCIRTEE